MLEAIRKIAGPASEPERVPAMRDDAACAAAEDRLAELEARERELAAKRGQLLSRLGEPGDQDLARRAEALLASGQVVEPDSAVRDRLRIQASDVVDQIHVVQGAIVLQRQVVSRERARVAEDIRQRIRPRHRQLAARVQAALQALTATLADVDAFHAELEAGGVPTYVAAALPAHLFEPVRLDREWSPASLWARESKREGLL
jgi:hypothetical protein